MRGVRHRVQHGQLVVRQREPRDQRQVAVGVQPGHELGDAGLQVRSRRDAQEVGLLRPRPTEPAAPGPPRDPVHEADVGIRFQHRDIGEDACGAAEQRVPDRRAATDLLDGVVVGAAEPEDAGVDPRLDVHIGQVHGHDLRQREEQTVEVERGTRLPQLGHPDQDTAVR
jgi:hypothetical protein